jgi:hypothetical protein
MSYNLRENRYFIINRMLCFLLKKKKGVEYNTKILKTHKKELPLKCIATPLF